MIQVAWCDQHGQIDQLATFFAEQVTPSYISHAELQGGRAVSPYEWAPNLKDIFREEIAKRVVKNANETEKRVAIAHHDGILVGLAYVTFQLGAPVPFVILEDIVIENSRRGLGVGQAMMDWLFERAKQAGAKRVFLESGKNNRGAHHFFERNHFRQISIVMMVDLK